MRYSKNMTMLTHDENNRLKTFKVLIIGCGGLGGYVIEMLSRLGVGHLICVDGDVFDESNLNRQLLSTEETIGKAKAEEAKMRIQAVNSDTVITSHVCYADEENLLTLSDGCDVVIDAVDNMAGKLMLEKFCRENKLPLIHGAIGGWYGQVTTVYPGDDTISFLYKNSKKGIESLLGNPSFTPGTIASIQVSECLKVLLKKGNTLKKQILMIDLLNHDYEIIDL